jgi:hypothetical protein
MKLNDDKIKMTISVELDYDGDIEIATYDGHSGRETINHLNKENALMLAEHILCLHGLNKPEYELSAVQKDTARKCYVMNYEGLDEDEALESQHGYMQALMDLGMKPDEIL